MKTTKIVETTFIFKLSPDDVLRWIKSEDLNPADREDFSFTVEGLGISKGAKIILKNQTT